MGRADDERGSEGGVRGEKKNKQEQNNNADSRSIRNGNEENVVWEMQYAIRTPYCREVLQYVYT